MQMTSKLYYFTRLCDEIAENKLKIAIRVQTHKKKNVSYMLLGPNKLVQLFLMIITMVRFNLIKYDDRDDLIITE